MTLRIYSLADMLRNRSMTNKKKHDISYLTKYYVLLMILLLFINFIFHGSRELGSVLVNPWKSSELSLKRSTINITPKIGQDT